MFEELISFMLMNCMFSIVLMKVLSMFCLGFVIIVIGFVYLGI